MKKTLTLTAVVVLTAAAAFAATINPTSNVLGDTAHTANTLVLRDGSGNQAVVTADIAANAVITAALYLDLPTERVACVTSSKRLGTCSIASQSNGGCTCN